MKSGILAQDIMDLYYQSYREDDQYFDIDFFDRQVSDAYAGILREEYEKKRAELRSLSDTKTDLVSFGTEWMKVAPVEFKDGRTKLPKKAFSFLYDENNVGIQDLIVDDSCGMPIRTTLSAKWGLCHLPKSDKKTYWWLEGDEIVVHSNCGKLEKAKVVYIPELDKDEDISQSVSDQIKRRVLELLFGAKNGNVVDKTNDNPNATAQTETNKESLK